LEDIYESVKLGIDSWSWMRYNTLVRGSWRREGVVEEKRTIGPQSGGQYVEQALPEEAVSLRRCVKVSIRYRWSRFDEAKETEHINDAVQQLQLEGANIVDIKTSVSQPSGGATVVVYTVIYDIATIRRQ